MIDASAGESQKEPSRHLSRILGCALLALVCVGAKGCPEANFRISSDPRLPRFIPIPPGYTPADLEVAVTVYTGGQAEIVARDRRNPDVVIFTGTGTFSTGERSCDGPGSGRGGFDLGVFSEGIDECAPYNTLTFMGESELVRRRRYNNVLYVVDESLRVGPTIDGR